MSVQSWVALTNGLEFSSGAQGAGPTYENSETEKAVSPGTLVKGEALVLPANFLRVGTVLRYTAAGWFSTTTAAAALTLGISSLVPEKAVTEAEPTRTVIAKSLLKTDGVKKTEEPWRLEATSICTKVGPEGVLKTSGIIYGIVGAFASETAGGAVSAFPVAASQGGPSGAKLPTGEERQIVLTAKWGAISTENKFAVTQWLVEALC